MDLSAVIRWNSSNFFLASYAETRFTDLHFSSCRLNMYRWYQYLQRTKDMICLIFIVEFYNINWLLKLLTLYLYSLKCYPQNITKSVTLVSELENCCPRLLHFYTITHWSNTRVRLFGHICNMLTFNDNTFPLFAFI